MSPTVPFDLLTNLALGEVFALAGREEVRRASSPLASRTLLASALFEAFVFLPLGIFLFFHDTAWSLMYFADPESMSPGMRVAAGVLSMEGYFLAILVGNLLTQALLRRGHDRAAEAALGATLAGIGVLTLLTWKRLLTVGTFAVWASGGGESLLTSTLGRRVFVAGIPFFVVLAGIVLKFALDDRKAQASA